MSLHRLPYRPDWDGLRAVAILSVLLCHAGLGFPGGFVGVDLFFVLSGFLITRLILKDLDQGSFSLAAFGERRLRRILPALGLVTVFTLVAGYLFMAPAANHALGQSAIALFALVPNFYFWWQTGYFSEEAASKPLLHTWSLGVEEQFYLFVAVLFLVLQRYQKVQQARWWLGGLAVCSFGLGLVMVSKNPSAGFFLLPSRAWELCAGSLLVFLPTLSATIPRILREVLSLVGFGMILFCSILYDQNTPFPGLAALVPVIGTILLLWTGEGIGQSLVHRLLSLPWMVLIGRISYPLYLWHWPILALVNYSSFDPPSPMGRLGLLGLSFFLSLLTYYFLELPIRSRRLLPRPITFIGYSGAMGVVVLLAVVILSPYSGVGSDFSPDENGIKQTALRDEKYLPNVDGNGELEGNLKKYGAVGASPEILIWGDSHAMAVLPAIESLCDENNMSALAATRYLTPPLGNYPPDDETRFNNKVLEYLKIHPMRAVILAGRWNSYLTDGALQDQLLETVDQIQAMGIKVFFLKDVPHFSYHVPRIIALNTTRKFEIHRLGVSRIEYETMNPYYESIVPELDNRGVQILDPAPYFAQGEDHDLFLPFDANGIFYRDSDHLTTHGALAIKRVFSPVFE